MKINKSIPQTKRFLALAGLAVLLAIAFPISSANAQLLWYANFNGVSNDSPVPTSGSTADGSMTVAASLSASPPGVVQTLNVGSTSGVMTTPPAITSSLNNTSATPYLASNWSDLQMRTLSTFGAGSTMIVSFDVSRETSPLPWFIMAVDSSGNQQGFTWLPAIPGATGVYRYTWINNNSGSSIVTPIGTLNTGNTAFYQYNGTTYVSDGINFGAGINMNGFRIITTGALSANTAYATSFDNFGVWANATDTFNSVSVLNLTPGTVVPEPSSILFLLMALPLFVLGRFLRHKQALQTVS